MEAIYKEQATRDLKSFDKQLRLFFIKHVEKLMRMPPRRHMKFGVPFHVENVTAQARLVYNEREDKIYIVRCFATHKEYENWYEQLR